MTSDKNPYELMMINGIVINIIKYLEEYDLEVSRDTLFDSVNEIVSTFMLVADTDRQEALLILEKNRVKIAQDIAEQILVTIAEERPGTDPYSHDRLIPLPVSFAVVLSNTLAIMVDLALFNDQVEKARRYAGFLSEYTDKIATYTIKELREGSVDNSPIGMDGVKSLPGPHIMMPQPALAQIARMITSLINLLESKEFNLRLEDPENERESVKVFVYNFRKQVLLLDILRERFGTPMTPRMDS